MRNRITENILANLASMSTAARRGMPVLLLYSSIEVVEPAKTAECKNYYVLPPAPDQDTAERTRNVLHQRGWSDFTSPEGLDMPSFSLAPPEGVHRSRDPDRIDSERLGVTESTNPSQSNESTEAEGEQQSASTPDQDGLVLEHFEGFVDYIEDDTAYVTLRSREHGDELSGQYSAALLSEKGIKEQNRFLCKTVRVGDATRVEIEAVPKVEVTAEQLQEIDDELNRMLPDDDDVDY